MDKFYTKHISNKKIYIVYPSRILNGKGQHIAIEAVKLLSAEILDNVCLKIVEVIYDKEYYKKIKELSKGLLVDFETNVPDIVPYYQQADIVIFPTIMEEGFGYTAVEAMACEKPVIYSDFPAIVEAAGNIGIKFRRGTASEPAMGIEKLYFDKELRLTIGKDGREYVLNHYQWGHVFKNYQTIVNEVLVSKKDR